MCDLNKAPSSNVFASSATTKTSLALPGSLSADAHPLDKISESINMDLHIKTHGSESRGQGGSTLRRPLDERM